MSMRILQSWRLLALLCAGVVLNAQTAPTPAAPVEFDVASIKPNKTGNNSSGVHQSNGLWRGNNNTVKSIITMAYDVLPDQISGGPSWIDADRFDIEAKYDQDPKVSNADDGKQTRLRLQALLASRFQLEIHRQTKEWQAYALIEAKKGPKLTPTVRKEGSSTNTNNGHMECKGVDMERLARVLSDRLGRPVANETAIVGRFDFFLDFEPEPQASRMSEKNNPISASDSTRPSLFTALQDQLGLKLESKKVPVEMLIIDRVERPSEN